MALDGEPVMWWTPLRLWRDTVHVIMVLAYVAALVAFCLATFVYVASMRARSGNPKDEDFTHVKLTSEELEKLTR